jgi:soluble lytic murein transglycosylase
MKLHKLKKLVAVLLVLATGFLYQNFTFENGWKISLIPINEKARSTHAKELLGSKYKGSPAQLVENANSLGIAIFNVVYSSLPKKHKKVAVNLAAAILKESEKHSFDPVFVLAIIKTESSFNPLARGSVGEIGLMQLKPTTAAWIAKKFKIPWKGPKTLENPIMNVRIGVAYMNYLREKFDRHANMYVSAYNMGAGRVFRMYASEQKPKEYSLRVMKHYYETYRRLAAATTMSLIAIN